MLKDIVHMSCGFVAGKVNMMTTFLILWIVKDVLQSKPSGEKILDEYNKTKTLIDGTWWQMVNLLVAGMVEVHG